MTSSNRHLKPGQPKWDYNFQCYKDTTDVFLEPGLFSIIILAHGRPTITRQCFLSTLECLQLYAGELEHIFIENGNCEPNYEFFKELNLERKVIIRQDNFGINEALNNGLALSRGEFIFILENDWMATCQIDFLSIAKEIFIEKSDIGIIQLRDPFDPNENHGKGKAEYNPWSCSEQQLNKAKIKVWREQTKNNHNYLISNHPNGFNNNPILIRKQVYRECGPYPEPVCGSDPRHGETLYQAKVASLGCMTAYVGIPIYQHFGRVQTQVI